MNAWEEMIVAAVQFAVWAAGEGLAPSKKGWQAPDGSPQGPEDFLYIFSRRTGHKDMGELPNLVRQYINRHKADKETPADQN